MIQKSYIKQTKIVNNRDKWSKNINKAIITVERIRESETFGLKKIS